MTSREPHRQEQPRSDDEWVELLLEGRVDADDPALQAHLREHPEFAKEVAELLSLDGSFRRVGSETKRVFDDLNLPVAGAVGELAGHRGAGDEQGTAPTSGGVRPLRTLGLLAAAAAVVLLLRPLWSPSESGEQGPEDRFANLEETLLSGSDFAIRVEGTGTERILTWDQDPNLGWFDLTVFRSEDGEPTSRVFEAANLFENRFPLHPLPWSTDAFPVLIRVEQRSVPGSEAWRSGSLWLRVSTD